MKTTTSAAIVAATLAALPAAAPAQTLPGAIVAVVDRQRIVGECTACKTAGAQLQGLIAQAQQRQQALTAQLQGQGQALQAEANRVNALADGPAKVAAGQALQPRVQSFQQQQDAARQELERLQQNIQSVNNNILRQIDDKLEPIVAQTMQQRGANLAIDQNSTLASAKSIDITDQVLTTLNTQLTVISATPLPQAQGQAAPAAVPTRPQPQGR